MTDPSRSLSARASRRPRASFVAFTLLLLAGCGGEDTASHTQPTACEDVPFTANSDDLAAEIRATGVGCDEARDLVRDSDGAPGPAFRGYSCTSRQVQGETVLVHSAWRCTRDDALVTWKRF